MSGLQNKKSTTAERDLEVWASNLPCVCSNCVLVPGRGGLDLTDSSFLAGLQVETFWQEKIDAFAERSRNSFMQASVWTAILAVVRSAKEACICTQTYVW